MSRSSGFIEEKQDGKLHRFPSDGFKIHLIQVLSNDEIFFMSTLKNTVKSNGCKLWISTSFHFRTLGVFQGTALCDDNKCCIIEEILFSFFPSPFPHTLMQCSKKKKKILVLIKTELKEQLQKESLFLFTLDYFFNCTRTSAWFQKVSENKQYVQQCCRNLPGCC